jgi:hypothetical protein
MERVLALPKFSQYDATAWPTSRPYSTLEEVTAGHSSHLRCHLQLRGSCTGALRLGPLIPVSSKLLSGGEWTPLGDFIGSNLAVLGSNLERDAPTSPDPLFPFSWVLSEALNELSSLLPCCSSPASTHDTGISGISGAPVLR